MTSRISDSRATISVIETVTVVMSCSFDLNGPSRIKVLGRNRLVLIFREISRKLCLTTRRPVPPNL